MAVTSYKRPEQEKTMQPAGTLRGVSQGTQQNLARYQQGYTPSQTVQNAQNQLQQVQNQRPQNYNSRFGAQLDGILQQIQNPQEFKYSFDGDEMFKYYADLYTQKGKQASMDAMGQAAALTGGYGNSYAQQVGQQGYQQYLMDLYGVGMDLQNQAYNRYRDQRSDLYNQLGAMQGMDETEYGRHRDTVADWQTDMDRATKAVQDERDFDYDNYRNMMNYWTNQADAENSDYWRGTEFDRDVYENDRDYNRAVYEDDRDYAEDVRRNNRDYDEDVLRDRRDYEEDVRRNNRDYDENVYRDRRDYAEDVRRNNRDYDRSVFTQDRAYEEDKYRDRRDYAEDVRRNNRDYDENVYRDRRDYDRDVYENDRDFNENAYRDRRNYDRDVYENDRDYNRDVYTQDRAYNRAVYQDDRDYNRDVFTQDRAYNEDVRRNNRDFDETQRLNNIDNDYRERNFGWQQETDQRDFDEERRQSDQKLAYNYAMAILANGQMPSMAMLEMAGLSEEDAIKMMAQLQATGGTGGTGGPGGTTNQDTTGGEETPEMSWYDAQKAIFNAELNTNYTPNSKLTSGLKNMAETPAELRAKAAEGVAKLNSIGTNTLNKANPSLLTKVQTPQDKLAAAVASNTKLSSSAKNKIAKTLKKKKTN